MVELKCFVLNHRVIECLLSLASNLWSSTCALSPLLGPFRVTLFINSIAFRIISIGRSPSKYRYTKAY